MRGSTLWFACTLKDRHFVSLAASFLSLTVGFVLWFGFQQKERSKCEMFEFPSEAEVATLLSGVGLHLYF